MKLEAGTHSVVIDGLDQRYHIHGSGPVVFAHSGGPGLGWEYLRMAGAEENLTVVYIEPIGTGASGRLKDPNGYTYSRYARQVAGLADHLGLDRITLIGHSSGGFVAQRFALEYPERVASLVLYDTTAVVNEEYYAEVMANVQAFPAKHPGREATVAEVMEAWMSQGAVTDDAGFSEIARRVFPLYFRDYWAQEDRLAPYGTQVRGWLAPQRAAGPVDDLAELPAITAPVLIIVGRHDFICGPRWSEKMRDALPQATLEILESSGHFGHLESPREFTRILTGFALRTAGRIPA